MAKIRYLTIEDVIQIHRSTIDCSGGGDIGDLDLGKMESVLCHIQNDDYYPEFIDKVVHLFFCVCKFHCFTDGNKRIAITITAVFLLQNGYMASANLYFREMENISYHVAAGHIDKALLRKLMIAILNRTFDEDEELKLEYLNAIDVEDAIY